MLKAIRYIVSVAILLADNHIVTNVAGRVLSTLDEKLSIYQYKNENSLLEFDYVFKKDSS
jgi:hypothetical protein